ncbi:MAG TPA: BRO family protein [Ktedonobacterales bacterium]|nr:BRO family protein [Ktedonobacterales bacterium]
MSDQINDQALLPFDGDGRIIRRQWVSDRWFFSVVDVVAVLTDSDAPRQYWGNLKRRVQDEGFTEVLSNCLQLKMRSLDGKRYATDAADTETLLRIIQSIPSPKAEPFKQWLAKVGTERLEEMGQNDLLAGLTAEQKAIFLRGQVADRNLTLADAAAASGVVTRRDFAIFQDHGYRGLYGGETARDIAARKGLMRGQQILDWMGPDELAANLFRASLTEQRLRNGPVDSKNVANRVHHQTGVAVRQVIIEQGATAPEQLPTPEYSIQELQKREQQQIEAERHPSLWPTDEQ